MATYDLSTFGRTVIVNEGTDDLPVVRTIFIMLIVFLALFLKFNEALVFWSNWLSAQNKRFKSIGFLYIFYTTNSVLHIVQSIDSIGRPVEYFVPKFLYKKYIVSTMELPFLINMGIIILGYFGFTQLVMAIFKCSEDLIRRKCRLILFYIIFSMLTLFHYRQEPPHSYTVWINTVIVGEALTGLLATSVVTYISYLNYKKQFNNNSNIDLNNLIHINENYMQSSDDEEIETYNKNKVQPMRQRSRSRTPTGTTQL